MNDSIPLREKLVRISIGIQLTLIVGMLVLAPGFDKPNELGLDFGSFLITLGLTFVIWLWGFLQVYRLKERKDVYIVVFLILPFIWAVFIGVFDSLF